jgi:hypothetical protein
MRIRNSPSELLGLVGGALLAPVFGVGSWLRRARFFHPEGVCHRAEVRPTAAVAGYESLAGRLAGPALVRFSAAWWRGGREWPDVLGCAIRFGVDQDSPLQPAADAQDLLFATIPRPWLTPLAPLWTQQHDFLGNTYWAVAPFEVQGVGLVRWRLLPRPAHPDGQDRGSRLASAVTRDEARLDLQARLDSGSSDYCSVAEVRLLERVELDQEALRFSPFRTGRGIEPRGFVHALRAASYRLSQAARPRSGRRR